MLIIYNGIKLLGMNTNAEAGQSLGFLLHDVARLWRKRFDRRAQTLGLTRAQWSVIAHLRRNEGITQTCLADLLEVEKITLARLIDRLEASGWVQRRPHPSDRRANCLYLTDKVHPILDQMWELGRVTRNEALAELNPGEREQLYALLARIKRNLVSTPD